VPNLFSRWCAAALIAVACGGSARADAIQFKDGRSFEVFKIVEAEGGYKLIYNAGEVFVKKDLVLNVLMSDASGNFVPRTDEEKANLEKGLVPWKGKWVAKAERDKQAAKEAEDAKKAMEEARKHQEWRDRYIEETAHFRFEYTIPKEKCKEYQVLMETYFTEFTKKWGIKVDPKTKKLPVCFYHDQEYYYQVSGAPRGAIGYFRFVEPIELNFYFDRNDERMTLDVMFHETNHYLTHLINTKFHYPPWVNESLAEYYGASEWDPVKKKMTVGNIQEGRLVNLIDAIKADEMQGLEEMIRLESFDALMYAWGWSFVHFLMEHKKYSAPFQKFYLALAQDKNVKREPFMGEFMKVGGDEQIRVLKQYLGLKDLKGLEKEWHEYVKGLKLTSYRGYEDAAQWADNWGMKIKAGRYYKTAIAEGTKNPVTFDNYGEWLQREGEWAEAVDMHRKAVELDPMNAWYYLHLGNAMEGAGDKEGGEKMKRLALELEPNDPWLAFQAKNIVIKGR
jgi:tetratricopeptide (TPR) repeat protein